MSAPLMSFERFALMPEVEARRALADAPLELRLLTPPYPVVALGTLRVLRVRSHGDTIELLAGYDGYERLAE